MPRASTQTTTTARKSTTTRQPVAKKAATARKTTARKAPSTAENLRAQEPTANQRSEVRPMGNTGKFGNLGGEPELRYTPSGLAVCNVSLAYTPYNFETKEQGETIWYRCIGFNKLAEQMATNLTIGMRVVVSGRAQISTWTDEEGNIHTNKEILLDAIGPDILFRNVSVQEVQRNSTTNQGIMDYGDEEPF